MKPSESLYFDVRGLRYHIRRWPGDAARRMVLLHGWMDVSASFQFLVDALEGDWDVYAPDWRGYGLTDSKPVPAKPGQRVNLQATIAPTPQAAAAVYPANYWYSLIKVPDKSEFPGTGPKGNGISPNMR